MNRKKKFLLLLALLPSVAFAGSSGGTSGGLPGADQVTESMLKVVNACTDEYVLTCETSGGGDFEWQAVSAGIGGSTGSNDNALLRSDGPGGATVQDSSVFVSDGTTPRIALGGTTSSFPSILRNGTQIRFVLADDSGFAPLDIGTATINTTLNAGSAVYIGGASAGSAEVHANGSNFYLGSGYGIGWGSNSIPDAGGYSLDVGLARSASGVLRISNGSTGVGSLLSGVLVEANTAGSGSPNIIVATESGTLYTNEGVTAANYHTLPTAAANLKSEFCVQDADGMRIVANTGDTIRVIDKVTASAGYIESTTIGSCVELKAINATEWFATSVHGVWTDGTFTYDDTGLTTP